MRLSLSLFSALLILTCAHAEHGVSAWGQLKYPKDFTHYEYTNPDAPQGGELVIAELGSFSSLNMFIPLGDPAAGLSLAHATLLEPAYDEVSSAYAYAAKDVEVSADRKTVTFTLQDHATFSDGTKITAEDVAFSFELLRTKGLPMFRSYYQDIEKAEVISESKIAFKLKSNKQRELPIILGQIPVLSKAFYSKQEFGKPSLTIPPVSGAYEIVDLKPGQYITYKKRNDWWGKSIPSHRGRMNFDSIRFTYYKDMNAMFQAFKVGDCHIRLESTARLWATAYDFPAVKDGKVKKDEIKHHMSSGTYGAFFNTRRDIFKNRDVRKAICLLFDFAWANKNLFYNAYKRNLSFFPNSDFAAKGPISDEEKAFLDRAKIKLSMDTLNGFTLPEPQNEEDIRKITAEALELLKKAGWKLKNQKLVNAKGEQFKFTLPVYDDAVERVFSSFVETLQRMGIDVKLRQIDPSSYQEKVNSLDFDMIMGGIPQSNSPGTELRDYFGTSSVNQKGSRNFAGINSKEIDALIEDVIDADTYEELKIGLRALDRALLDSYYMLPAWHRDTINIAYWDQFDKPKIAPKYMPLAIDTWWFKGEETEQITEDQLTLWQKIKNWLRGLLVK